MEILFVASELAPYAKIGGLADVASALPKALRALGHRVTMVLPRYPAFEEGGLLLARRLTPLAFKLGTRTFEVTVYDVRLPSQVELVLVDAPGLFDRPGVYGERGEDYVDNALRFAVLSRAAAELARLAAASGAPYDVVHCHDWPAALVPAYLDELRRAPEAPAALSSTRTVLTIHNVAHQGLFPKETLPDVGFGWERFTVEGFEFYGKVNLLKQGVLAADAVTTVSSTYAREIQTEGLGHGLEGVLRARGASLAGVVNGVDHAIWNPATDAALAARYDAEDMATVAPAHARGSHAQAPDVAPGKVRCRGALLKELGLPMGTEGAIVAFVGRLVPQKGIDLVVEMAPRLLRGTEAVLVVAGDGDPATVERVAAAAERSHGRMVFARAASEVLVHRIFGGADVVLVPSRREPCGLVQLYAQRYGAVPVGRATGGLVDTIVDCDAHLETGTGFLFEEDTASALLGATERAIAARAMPGWPALLRRIMRLDRGWERPARRYEQVFRSLAAAR